MAQYRRPEKSPEKARKMPKAEKPKKMNFRDFGKTKTNPGPHQQKIFWPKTQSAKLFARPPDGPQLCHFCALFAFHPNGLGNPSRPPHGLEVKIIGVEVGWASTKVKIIGHAIEINLPLFMANKWWPTQLPDSTWPTGCGKPETARGPHETKISKVEVGWGTCNFEIIGIDSIFPLFVTRK